MKPDRPVFCSECGRRSTVERFRNRLTDLYLFSSLPGLRDEFSLLCRTRKMYERYPESRDKMRPLHENDRQVMPRDEDIMRWTDGDQELAEWLLTRSFRLDLRIPHVKERIAHLESSLDEITVRCPDCHTGVLAIDQDRYEEFSPFLV